MAKGKEPDRAGLNPRWDRNTPRKTRGHPGLCISYSWAFPFSHFVPATSDRRPPILRTNYTSPTTGTSSSWKFQWPSERGGRGGRGRQNQNHEPHFTSTHTLLLSCRPLNRSLLEQLFLISHQGFLALADSCTSHPFLAALLLTANLYFLLLKDRGVMSPPPRAASMAHDRPTQTQPQPPHTHTTDMTTEIGNPAHGR